MTRLDRGKLTCRKLAAYFLEGAKPRPEWRLGIEVEKMGLDRATGRPIPYDGAGPSVRKVLEAYHGRRGGAPVYEGENLIGIEAEWGSLSLEPGGQVEWSSRPCPDLPFLETSLQDHLGGLDQIASELGVLWLDVAVQPDVPVHEMPWMPKARYGIMKRFLGERGRLAHKMMTQTASIQCSFDYEDARDWARKFRAAALLAPVAVALFANSSRADGRDTGYRSFRQAIWRETDPDRCSFPAAVFEPGFGIDPWMEWACDVPTIFRQGQGGLVPSGGVPFRMLLEQAGCEAVSLEDWELHLSSIFTEVRSYTYIEARSADLQPDELIMAVPAFWTGLLYHERALGAALKLGAPHDAHALWMNAMDEAARRGLDGDLGSPLRDLAARALGLAVWSLRHGAAGAGDAGDAAALLLRLADRHRLDPAEPAP